MLLLVTFIACGPPNVELPEATVEIFESERGPDMVAVAGADVVMGAKRIAPVDGFVPPPIQNQPGGAPTGAPIGAPDAGIHGDNRANRDRNATITPIDNPLPPRLMRVSSFKIDRTEVTREQYSEFIAATGYREPRVEEPWAEDGWNWDGAQYPEGSGNHPVVLVSWYDAREFCSWAGKRLPTEAEWQLAALGPSENERVFPWGNEYDANALNHGTIEVPNFDDSDGYYTTSPVGAFPSGASPYGALDMFGNAWEWTADFRVRQWELVLGERQGQLIIDPHTAAIGFYAAVRGGSYFFDLRPNPAGERNAFLPEIRRKTSGFRCAL
jgi:formylglycine-generating enzyme required for sulfatase activity